MDTDQPPSAPDPLGFKVPTPMASAPRRPGLLTAAAVLLFIFGAFGFLAGLWLLAGSHGAVSLGRDQARGLGFLPVAIGVLYIAAGVGILGLRPAGQVMGFVSAGIMILNSLLRLRGATGSAITGLVVAGFVIYALAAHAPLFRTSARR
jgi:hypothetical protein